MQKNLKIKWYRPPIENYKYKEFVTRNDFKGYLHSFGHLFLWSATGFLSYQFFNKEAWLGFAILLFLHGTVGSFFGPAQHELGHGTVFKSRRVNVIFHIIFSTLGFTNIQDYKMSHTYHHLNTLHPEGDGEVVLPLNPTLRFFFVFQLFTVNLRGIYSKLNYFLMTSFNMIPTGSSVGAGEEEGEWIKILYKGEPEKR